MNNPLNNQFDGIHSQHTKLLLYVLLCCLEQDKKEFF